MTVVYERSGGITGRLQSIRIDAANQIQLRRGVNLVSERALTAEETKQAQALIQQAHDATPPKGHGQAPRISDSFMVTFTFEGEAKPRASLSTMNFPVSGLGEPWDGILQWFDAKLNEELEKSK